MCLRWCSALGVPQSVRATERGPRRCMPQIWCRNRRRCAVREGEDWKDGREDQGGMVHGGRRCDGGPAMRLFGLVFVFVVI